MSTTFWIQLLGIIFGVAMLYFTFLKKKRAEVTKFEYAIWSLGWVLLIVLALFPFALDSIIGPLNFYRRLDFFVVIGFFVLLALSFYNYSLVKRIDRRVEIVVRKHALDEKENTKK